MAKKTEQKKPRTRTTRETAKERITRYLKDNGTYITSDNELINLYAETYEFYRKMQDEMKEQSFLMEYTNKAGATNTVKNPLAVELSKTTQTLNNLLKSLGLTPAQRKALADGNEGGGDDDFDQF